MSTLNPFTNPAFSMASLTEAINLLPNMYGRIGQLNLMPGEGVPTRTIWIEEQNGVLNLLPTQPPGSPGTLGRTGKRKARSFVIPHIPHDDVVLPEEVQGIRAFGSETAMQTISGIVNRKLQGMKNKHDITLEYLRMGALKGIILDADGSSTIANLYTEFGISQKTVSCALATAGTDVRGKCVEVIRHIEDNLLGEIYTGVHCLCSRTFFDSFINHANVAKVYQNWAASQQVLGGNLDKGFAFGGMTFEVYHGRATNADGTTIPFIADDEAHAFPLGTMQSFKTYYAPADFNDTANTLGLPYYAKQEPRKFDRGIDLHTQSNPLPLCQRPALLVKLTKS
jgi:hypothetical protein